MIVVSGCLVGLNCRYDGKDSGNQKAAELTAAGKAVPVCPEQLGGCGTPRQKAEIAGGTGADVLDGRCRVVNQDGEDVTRQFVAGAEEVLKLARLVGAGTAVLKAKSPSCGCGRIYDGSFSGKLRAGNGVTAELLKRNGIEVVTEEELQEG